MPLLSTYHPVAGLVPADSDIGKPIPFPPSTIFPFLHLPPEIRLKIYNYLYRSHLPIYPTTLSANPSGLTGHGILKRSSFPTTLLLANRQIHNEASAVLWGSNTIHLQFPRDWNREREHCTLLARPQPRWFAPSETYVPPSCQLQRIRHLVLEIHLFRCSSSPIPAHIPAEPGKQVRAELTDFITALNERGHRLQTLEIRFTPVLSSYNPNEILVSWTPLPIRHCSDVEGKLTLPWTAIPVVGCCSNFGRNVFGRKDLEVQELERLCRMSVDVDQRVLEPLMALRGVREVRVLGRVTEDWADFLRASIVSEVGEKIGSFRHGTVVGWDELDA